MKWKLLIISCLFGPLAIKAQPTNQRLFDTIGFLPEYYPQRVAEFVKERVVEYKIIVLGNSITQMGDWKKLMNDSTVINRGISGDITFGVLKRLDDIIIRKPAKLFLLIGINDIGKDIPDTVIADNIRKIITRLQQETPSTKIYVESILPVNSDIPGFPQHYDKQEHILRINKMIRNVAQQLKVPYVNIHDLFTDAQGRLDAKYTQDGLHLNPKGNGYTIWVEYLLKMGYL